MAYGTTYKMYQLSFTLENHNIITLECPEKKSQGRCMSPDLAWDILNVL